MGSQRVKHTQWLSTAQHSTHDVINDQILLAAYPCMPSLTSFPWSNWPENWLLSPYASVKVRIWFYSSRFREVLVFSRHTPPMHICVCVCVCIHMYTFDRYLYIYEICVCVHLGHHTRGHQGWNKQMRINMSWIMWGFLFYFSMVFKFSINT